MPSGLLGKRVEDIINPRSLLNAKDTENLVLHCSGIGR